jgi:DNA-binding cell septation regulator SpoVG|tara:strand:+ start:472 stop:738 length:267 start_codon:yes stop_codon:yes gene_type:complete
MIISKIKIHRIVPKEGHVGFVSFIVDDWLFLNNIALFTRLDDKDKIRLVFPEKTVAEKKVSIFHPLTNESYFSLEKSVLEEYNKLYEN